MNNPIKKSIDFHGKPITFETGRVAKQAGGSVLVTQGDTMVLVTACLGSQKDVDFLPLTVDYFEKTYAGGRIPGGFFKREGRQIEKEILTSRLIDRPHRPLFPKGFNYETQIVATVLSADPQSDPDVLALCGASAALTVSEIPIDGPVAAVRVGRVGGDFIINPSNSDRDKSDLNLIVAGTRDAIVMVEGGADCIPEAEMVDALFFAHESMQPIIDLQETLQSECGKSKIEFTPAKSYDGMVEELKSKGLADIKEAMVVREKDARKAALKECRNNLIEAAVPADDVDFDQKVEDYKTAFSMLHSETVREMILG